MPVPSARYRDALALPHTLFTFCAALLGRAAYALVLLPLLYAVTEASGSLALAGAAVAAYGAGASFLAPARALLIDCFGARRVLAALIVSFCAALTVLAVTTLAGGPGTSLVILAALAGVVAPPLGPTMRVAWGILAPSPELLKKGLSVDAVAEELLYLLGPALAGLALSLIAPGYALLIPAVLVLVGGLLFVATPVVGAMGGRSRSRERTTPAERSLLRRPRFVAVLIPVFVAGAVSGNLSVAVPAMVAEDGGAALAGIALGLFAGGSAVGGLLYGALHVRGSTMCQLVVLSTALLLASSASAFVAGGVALSLVLAGAGLFFSPVMVIAYAAAHVEGGEHRRNAATTWVNTSHNIGSSAATAVAGGLIQFAGVSAAVLATAGVLALLLVGAMLLSRRS